MLDVNMYYNNNNNIALNMRNDRAVKRRRQRVWLQMRG